MANEADFPQGKFMSMVTVGAKGQIVIPKQARDLFGIKPGDRLVLLADEKRGIAINKYDFFDKIAEMMFNGKPAADIPEDDKGFSPSDIESKNDFFRSIKSIKQEDDNNVNRDKESN